MEEKQLTFEMDDQHIARMEKLLKKFKTPNIKNEYIGADRLYADILRTYLQVNKNELPDFDLVDFNDMQCIATYLVQRFGYYTYILGISSHKAILIWSCLQQRFHCTLKSFDVEYKALSKHRKKDTIDFAQKYPDLNNIFPSEVQFITIFYFHIKHMLNKANVRIQYTNSFIGPYFLKRMVATYLCKKQMKECPVNLFGNFINSWEGLLNLFQIGTNCINAKRTPDGTLFGGLSINNPFYQHNGYFAEFVQQIKSADKAAVTKLIGALTNENSGNLQKLLWLLGKIILGHQFINAMNYHDNYSSQLTIIKCTGTDIKSIYDDIACILDGSNYINRNANCFSNFLHDSYAWGFDQPNQSCFGQILNDAKKYKGTETAIENDIFQSIYFQFMGVIANVQVEPDVPAHKREFVDLLFNGKAVSLKDAYKITIGQSKEDNTTEIAFSIPNGLSYTNDLQHIIITAGLTKYTKQLLEENQNSANCINMEKYADIAPLLDKEKIIRANNIGKLVMLGMLYVVNKLCLGIDAFDMIEQDTSSSYHEERTESEYIGEFCTDCIEDLTGDLDPAETVKNMMTELKRARKRYEDVTWDNTGDETAKTVRESLKLNKLDSVSRYDLLVSYQKWKELKNITTPQPKWAEFSTKLINHLKIMQNQELAKYPMIFICRKTMYSRYDKYEKENPDKKQFTGILGIQLNKTWFEKLTNEKAVQEVQEKENYEKVLSLLEAQFDDAMKEIQSFKIPPQPYMP